MDGNQFIKEVHEYIDKRFQLFNEYQNIVLDILQVFDVVCKKANIEYVLAFGNLIGAIRDKNVQVPWDYDVDVTMSYEDKDKLITALEKYLPPNYYYCYNNNTDNYPAPCLRVCKKGYTWLALHVDVFFVIGLPENQNKRNRIIKIIRKLSTAKITKNYRWHQVEKQETSPIKRILEKLIILFKYGLSSGYKLEKVMDKYVKKQPITNSKFVMPVGTIATIIWEKEWLKPQNIILDGKEYPVPQGYDDMLRPIFGDYMSYLSIRKRFDEFYNMSNIVETRQHYFENK